MTAKADLGTVKTINTTDLTFATASAQFATPKTTNPNEILYKAAYITYDPFYSPILQKIDKILNELKFTEEPCRERLICSMYKNPAKFSPHSNLISAELSRLVQIEYFSKYLYELNLFKNFTKRTYNCF